MNHRAIWLIAAFSVCVANAAWQFSSLPGKEIAVLVATILALVCGMRAAHS